MLDLQFGTDESHEPRRQFRSQFSRQKIAKQAEVALKQRTESGGSCLMFSKSAGGLIGHMI